MSAQDERKARVRAWVEELRDRICTTFEDIEREHDGQMRHLSAGKFERTPWQRPGEDGSDAGGGVMSVMKGRVFEKVGVNVSTVYGRFSPEFAATIPGAEKDSRFWACGISLVAHMQSPHVPAVHMNTRHMVTTESWFGGGADLTPMYPNEDDARHFHAALKRACDAQDQNYYGRFKKWCDEYFFLQHRNEPRGIGGIFFDYLEGDFDKLFAFVQDCGDHFLDAYLPVVGRRKDELYAEQHRRFQEFRRGRYVEFNLIYDRGTLFGLKTSGRTESILMSLPPVVRWLYDWQPAAGTREAELNEYLKPRDWANEK